MVLALAGTPALAQGEPAPPPVAQAADAPAAAPEAPTVDEIVVIADRVRGQVDTASPPVVELDEKQVAAYGASSIADLVAQLAPEIGSGRGRGGRPVFLLNGQRIANFREMSRFPPEAIRKVEVLPEEVALKFGYPADQRVINFILKDNFASREVEASYGQPTSGGYSGQELEGSLLTINGPRRLSASVDLKNRTPLTEAERGIIQTPGSVPTVAGDPDPAAFRTLVARDRSIELNLTRTAALGEGAGAGQLTLNGQVLHDVTNSLSGLDSVLLVSPTGATALRALGDPLNRRTVSDTYSLGSSFNKPIGAWQLTATLDLSRGIVNSTIDRRRDTSALVAAVAAGSLAIDGTLPSLAGAGSDSAKTKTYTLDSLATLVGRPFTLPGGDASLTLTAGYKMNGIDSRDSRSAALPVSLDRRRVSGGFALGLPITSRREDFGAAIGDLTLNLAGGLDHLSDFGTLYNSTVGLVWKPTERLGLQATYITKDVAPSLSDLGSATLVNFNLPTYDFSTGQTVLITTTSGGNPNLLAEKQRDLKLSANYDLKLLDRASLLVEYYRNRSSNVTAGFPLLTPAIEAAFPGRVTRAADGTLLAIDARPVTFASTASDRIRYGISLFGKVGKPTPQGEGEGNRRGGGNGGGVRFGAAAAPPPTTGPAPATTAGTGSAPSGATAAFDPARFAQMRAALCATPEGQAPDLSALPERLTERLKDENGKIDPAKVAAFKARVCAAEGTGGARRFDPERFAAMRKALACDDPNKAPDAAGIPPEVADRLKGPDGTIAPDRLKEFKNRICALPAPAAQPASDGGGNAGNRGGRGGGGGGGGAVAFGRGGGDGQGRWSLSLYHTINLTNRVTIASGGPVLDLLNGDATGNGGGTSRHQVELEGGVFYKGFGARLSGNWSSATRIRGSGLPGTSDLRFGDLATFNLRTFVALDQQKWLTGSDGNPGFWKGARLSLKVNNLFDTRQRVTDASGIVPLRYQPGLIDPTGRYVEVEFRKVF